MPEEMKQIAQELSHYKDKKEVLHKLYSMLRDRFVGDRLKTFIYAPDLFSTNVSYLRNRRFLHCTNSNYLLRHLLVASGLFDEQDIRLKRSLIRYVSPHQYVQVRTDNKRINVDIRAATYGIKFGDYAHGFHGRVFKIYN